MRAKFNLKVFQTQFIDALFSSNRNAVHANIIPAGKLKSVHDALALHRRGYVVRLSDALGEIYEAVWRVLGDKDFFSVCEKYVLLNKSSSYNLSHYGRSFAEFVDGLDAYKDLPFISDLAKVDLAFFDTFHARSHDAIEPIKLAEIETRPESIFVFASSVKLLEIKHTVYEIWQQRNQSECKITTRNVPQWLIFFKNDGRIFSRELKQTEFAMLSTLQAGKSFSSCLNDFSHLDKAEISSLFFFIAQSGIVTDLRDP